MVNEVVGNIIEAEDKAEQIKKDAREAAKQLVSTAQSNSDERRAAWIKECRALSEERKKDAAKKADTAYAEVVEEGKKQAAELGEAYGKNVDKAVAAVVAAVIA